MKSLGYRGQKDKHEAEQQDGRVSRDAHCESAPPRCTPPRRPAAQICVVSAVAPLQRLPSSPCGRMASTMTMITKVKTVA